MLITASTRANLIFIGRSFLRKVPAALTDVDNRSAPGVGNGTAEHFMSNRRGVPFAEKDVAEEIRHRIAFCPTEVCVGHFARSLLQFDEQGRDGVCHHGAAGKKNAVPAYLSSVHGQRIPNSEESLRSTAKKNRHSF